jgi:hypothetical protein
MEKNYPTCVLCDTLAFPSYSDYVEWCEGCADCEPQGENSEDFWDWSNETRQMDFDGLLANVSYSDESKVPCIITGQLGLWNGRPTIHPVLCDNVHDAIMRCLGSCDDIKVVLENGALSVYAYHHDGTNHFTIHKLSESGKERLYAYNHGYIEQELEESDLAKWEGYIY